MKNQAIIGILLILLSSCARYEAGTLENLQPELAPYAETKSGVTLYVKKFTRDDCKRILDRDLIRAGYQPLQLTIKNDTKKFIVFSNQDTEPPTVPVQEVAEKVHTATPVRVIGYVAAGIIFWPMFIPAVVDGVLSSEANRKLDKDFDTKSLEQAVIQPYATINGIIFLSLSESQEPFEVILVDGETNDKISYRVTGI